MIEYVIIDHAHIRVPLHAHGMRPKCMLRNELRSCMRCHEMHILPCAALGPPLLQEIEPAPPGPRAAGSHVYTPLVTYPKRKSR